MVGDLLVGALLHTFHHLPHDVGKEGHELTGSLLGHDARLIGDRDRRTLKGRKVSGKGLTSDLIY